MTTEQTTSADEGYEVWLKPRLNCDLLLRIFIKIFEMFDIDDWKHDPDVCKGEE